MKLTINERRLLDNIFNYSSVASVSRSYALAEIERGNLSKAKEYLTDCERAQWKVSNAISNLEESE